MRKGVEKTARVELFYREGKGKIGPVCSTHTSGAIRKRGAKKHRSSHTSKSDTIGTETSFPGRETSFL